MIILKNDNSTLSHAEIAEHLSHIKTITLQKKEYGKQTGPFLVIWGIIWVIGFLISSTNWESIVPWTWILLGVIGWLFTFILYFKQEKNEPLPTLLRTQLQMILIGCVCLLAIFSFLIISNILPFSFTFVFFYMTLLISIMYVFLGAIFGKEIFVMGIWIGIITMVTFTWFPSYSEIIYAIIGGGSLVFSGFWLIHRGREDE